MSESFLIPDRCPRCGSPNVAPIAYGFPDREALEASRQGKVVLGGCEVGEETACCRKCWHRWVGEVGDGVNFYVHFAADPNTPLPAVGHWQAVRARDEMHAVILAARLADLSWARPHTVVSARVVIDWDADSGAPKKILTIPWRNR